MENRFGGGCACGAVRYESNTAIEFAMHCQCRRCQRMTGTGHASSFAVASAGVRLCGPIKYFEKKTDSGTHTQSGFCPECGSPILSKSDKHPAKLYLHAATLDDPSIFSPSIVAHRAAGQIWDYIDPRLDS